MLDVRVNLLKNRLYVTLSRVRQHELENSLQILENATKKLAPGFTCIARLIDFRGFDSRNGSLYEKIEQSLCDCGMVHMVRIGGCNDWISGASGICTFADTVEAADQILDRLEASCKAGSSTGLSN